MPRLGPATPEGKPSGLGFCAFARHYLRNRVCFLLLEVLRCFTSLRVAPAGLSSFIPRRHPVKGAGFPHSEIPGSKPVGGSPELIAALCVLHRLMMPRHPSHARIRLARDSRYLVTLQFSLTSSLRLSKTERKTVLRPRRGWWRQPDSNRRHPACKAGTLPAELCPPSNGQATAEREWLSGDGDSATAHPPPPAACSLHWWA